MAEEETCFGPKCCKIVPDERTNDSTSVSTNLSINGDSLDSDSNTRKPTQGGHPDSDANLPVFSIKFRDRDVARKYRNAVKEFLKDLISKHEQTAEECELSDLELDIWEEPSEDVIDISTDDEAMFTVDTRPTMKDELDVPSYCQAFSAVLQHEEEAEEVEDKNALAKSSCFNCLGNHTLRECTEPRNPTAITKNRRAYGNKHGFPSRHVRYHTDEEQKFASYSPGVISKSLSKALGLTRHELPRHIYRMRLLGYPPGWLEDAKVSHSGISLFDSQGKEVADLEDEEGEIVLEGAKDKYNVKKIVTYPGFNTPCSPGTLDNWQYFHCPPMNVEQSKDVMISNLNSTQAYKKKKLSLTPTTKCVNLVHSDMDVDEMQDCDVQILPANDNCRFIPPLPKGSPARPPPPPIPVNESDSEGCEARVDSPMSTDRSSGPHSPSLSDLETKKRLLLAELEDGGSSNDTIQPRGSPAQSNLGKVKSVDLGTPILQSQSPFFRLPTANKFSQGICDMLNFENLPDAIGKYERMSHVIQKVRVEVNKLQQENND